MASENTLEALQSFVGNDGKEDRMFRAGDLVKSSDPAVKKWPHLFGAPHLGSNPRIEQATRAPGEKR